EKLARDHPGFPLDRDRWSQLIYMLADLSSCFPEERFHNPGQALKLARRAVELKPEDGTARQSLGWAQYRVGDWKGCIESLMKTDAPTNGSFIGAMAHWQLGDKAKARDLFDRADQWLKGYEERCSEREKRGEITYPFPRMLRRVRTEAAALLGVG